MCLILSLINKKYYKSLQVKLPKLSKNSDNNEDDKKNLDLNF